MGQPINRGLGRATSHSVWAKKIQIFLGRKYYGPNSINFLIKQTNPTDHHLFNISNFDPKLKVVIDQCTTARHRRVSLPSGHLDDIWYDEK